MRSLLLPEKGEPYERSRPKLEERRQTHLATWGLDCRKVVRRRCPAGVWDFLGRAVRRRSARRKPQGSGVERFLGARKVVGLQTLVRGAFPVLLR